MELRPVVDCFLKVVYYDYVFCISENEFMDNLVNGWEVVIGLEVHAQIASKSKLFSDSPTTFGADPNTQVSFYDAAMPGMLPVVNAFCIDQAVKTGYGINGKIQQVSIFDRKNYFYPDLPSGYQISQLFSPIVRDGFLIIELQSGEQKTIGIDRIHIEQDAGKSIHDLARDRSFVDLNRAGVPLMEIVSRPDMRSSYEAMAYVKKLRMILRYIGSCDCNMEMGNLRVDANISLRKPGDPLGQRAEIKNINSIKFLGQALDYEVKRQMFELESGRCIVQETRLFDAGTGETRSMRTKEDAADYRYFHDPDLKPVVLSDERLNRLKSEMPELPDEKKERFMATYGLSLIDATVLVDDITTANLYEEAVGASKFPKEKSAKLIANWMIGDLFALLNKENKKINEIDFSIIYIAEMVDLILNETISGKIAKTVFEEVFKTKNAPSKIVKDMGLEQIQDEDLIENVVRGVMERNGDKVLEYKSGKDKLFGFFVGQTMSVLSGKASPAVVNSVLKRLLS